MRFHYLLADNDNTLMDFDAAERLAFSDAMQAFGIPEKEDTYPAYHIINKQLWEALERGETTQDALKVERFARLLTKLGRADVDAAALADCYSRMLGNHADLMPGCMEFLNRVHGKMKIAFVSNGVGETQRSRLARCPFTPMMDAILISGEIGVSKPDPRVIDMALQALGCTDKADAVFLGDSATADVAAANAAGVASIHLAIRSKPSDKATWVVHSLAEAADLLLED